MLKRFVQKADSAGPQCALHAIGDATIKFAIDSIESVGTTGRRHRIEYLELTSSGDAKCLSNLRITASIQAVHADPVILRAWPKPLGQDRFSRAFAYREFLDDDAHLALGTDAPTAPHILLANLYVVMTRRSAKESKLTDTVNAYFALLLTSALSDATAGSAFSCLQSRRLGLSKLGRRLISLLLICKWSRESCLRPQWLRCGLMARESGSVRPEYGWLFDQFASGLESSLRWVLAPYLYLRYVLRLEGNTLPQLQEFCTSDFYRYKL